MNKIVLAYNFNMERLQQLRQVCMIMKVNCKAVAPEQIDDAAGFLAGVKDCPRTAVNPPDDQESQLMETLEEAAKKAGEDPGTVKKDALQLLMQASQKELVLLCGFDMHLLNQFLTAVKRSRLKSIELKAALTPTNQYWSGRHLLQEIAAEHVYMKQFGKNMHK